MRDDDFLSELLNAENETEVLRSLNSRGLLR